MAILIFTQFNRYVCPLITESIYLTLHNHETKNIIALKLRSKIRPQLFVDDEDDGVGGDQSDEIGFQTSVETRDPALLYDVRHDVGEVRFLPTSEVKHDCPDHHDRVGEGRGHN